MISKKELLELTGISYGQLYRWKREELIPEDWFIKQSSFTGQETFFPREKILNRIHTILKLKDQYSLEEMAKMLSPELEERCVADNLNEFEEINNDLIPVFIREFGKEKFTFREVLVMIALSEAATSCNLLPHDIADIVGGLKANISEMKSAGYILDVAGYENRYYTLLHRDDPEFYWDNRFKVVTQIYFGRLSDQVNLKYKNIFNLV